VSLIVLSPGSFSARRLVAVCLHAPVHFVPSARRETAPPKANVSNYLATGIVNSAPFAMLSGHLCMMLL
jgi:hypothetical protein